MGAVCSCVFKDDKKKLRSNDDKSRGSSGKLKSMKRRKTSDSYYSDNYESSRRKNSKPDEILFNCSGELVPVPPLRNDSTKFMQRNSFMGRAGVMGLEKAVEVLDTLGSSMSSMNTKNGFLSGTVTSSRDGKVSILAFEVANTIAKGAALLQSLSEENLKLMKKDMLRSKGVKKLVSTDTAELQILAASDKREELDIFSGEVIRFGNRCRDLQWHNLDRYFTKLDTENSQNKLLKDETEASMQELVSLARFTSELYHEWQALDRFEQDYRRKRAEVESLNLPKKGESVVILQSEVKQQRKLVRSLKKKSLWSRNLEEIIEKLVDVVCYIRQTIVEVFGNNGIKDNGWKQGRERLGEAGLSLHYANLIQQIDSIASRPSSLPSNVRDTLYNALPATVKTALRPRLQTLDPEEELSISEIKAEMEKSLQWLVPFAANTTKAHQGFGWVGEWANSRIEFGKGKGESNVNPTRLQTLHHADKTIVDSYVLELVVWLHRLMKSSKKRVYRANKFQETNHVSQPNDITISNTQLSLSPDFTYKNQLSLEDRLLLDRVQSKRHGPNVSKSQELVCLKKNKKGIKIWPLSRSTGNSPKVDLSDKTSPSDLDALDGLDFGFQ
ncbi:Protein PSK SIMULATOR 2 [Cardamine amara subsp. amara]|uniref:Protein PSK SIMULATOR 2 n=1 Tax=Cardamine amara subsp. amara TaxID=228776 RepID=A0ABD1B1R6_CARAN